MNLFFTIPDPSNTKEIIGNSNFEEHYPQIHKNKQWKSLKPHIRNSTIVYLLPYLGQEMYDKLVTRSLEATPSTNAAADLVILHLRDALANYTIYKAMPSLNVVLTDMGVQQYASSEGTSNPANQWSFKSARAEALKTADQMMDTALKLMELEVAEGNAYFDEWKASKEYSDTGSILFRQTIDMDKYLNIQGSRRSFISLSKYMKKSEEFDLEPIIGTVLLDKLSTYVRSDSNNIAMAGLQKYATRMVAELGLAKAIPHLSILVEGDGFKVMSSSDGMDDKKNILKVAIGPLEALKEAAIKDGKTYRASLIEFLHKEKESFPEWTETDYYKKFSEQSSCPIVGTNQGGVMF